MNSRQTLQTLPDLWLISDQRNDELLETVLRSFTCRIGFIFRHYHMPEAERRVRFDALARIARRYGHCVILSGPARRARAWGADGFYGPPANLVPRRRGLLALATAHDMGEIAQANRLRADAVLLSPVFPTRSHPGARTLGAMRFLLMAQHAQMPVIALGGMDSQYARQLRWPRWAGVDGMSTGEPRPDS